MLLGQLVQSLGGELQGGAELEVTGIAPLERATEREITFLSNRKLREQAKSTRACALALTREDSEALGDAYAGARIVVSNPYAWFARAAQMFAAQQAVVVPPGIHPTAVVDAAARVAATAVIGPHVTIEAGAEVGEGCVIEAGCFIGRGARVGSGTHFHPRVSFMAGSQIGERGLIKSGAVIGADGFGFANEKGAWIKIPQTGRVIMGNDVEIGVNTCVDRGAMDDTVLEDGVKLDNLIQIAHNCRIGAHTAMAACVGVAGSTRIGRHCTFGGAAMIVGHIEIADHVHISGGTLISRSIREPGQYTSVYPFAKHAEWEKGAVALRRLDDMRVKLRELEKAMKVLQGEAQAKPQNEPGQDPE